MNKTVFFSGIVALTILLAATTGYSFAHPHMTQIDTDEHPHTEITPLGPAIGLEKSIISFHAPHDNDLPWGFVEGKIARHVDGYPVIIQIFRDGDAVHFAQADVSQNGTYEYKFRVQSTQNGDTTRIFDGDYTVNIFKVVYLDGSI